MKQKEQKPGRLREGYKEVWWWGGLGVLKGLCMRRTVSISLEGKGMGKVVEASTV
jgi:hypothetical protein